MQMIKQALIVGAFLVGTSSVVTLAQPMPQDSWFFSHKWGSYGTGDGQFKYPYGIAIASDGRVFVAGPTQGFPEDGHRIQVFESDGAFVRKWGTYGSIDGQFKLPQGVAISPNGRVVVADRSNHRIQVFEPDGTFVRKWGSEGTQDGQFEYPIGVAVASNGRVFVTESVNHRIQVFESDGTFVRKWGAQGTLDGQFNSPSGIAIAHDGRVFVADRDNNRIQVFESDGTFVRKWGSQGTADGRFRGPVGIAIALDGYVFVAEEGAYLSGGFRYNSAANHRIQVFEPDGTFLRKWGSEGTQDGQFDQPQGIAVSSNSLIVVVDSGNSRIQVFDKSGYRIAPRFGAVPTPYLANCTQRPGTPYLDSDYVVWDQDNAKVTVAMAAFADGTNSLNTFVRMSSFVDGTQSALGTNIAANVTNRVSWNVAADWQADYVNLKVRVMAQDERGLLAVDFITLPTNGVNPALTISRFAITQSDMLPLWFWLLARNDPAVNLINGQVLGVGGPYDGSVLAQNTNTTATGRSFLFQRLGVREATAPEINRARTGPSGVVNQWTPRITIGPGDRPKAQNEYGFDTGNWGSDGWWVVKE